ncbi:MarR family transcriptional regulator [Schumannella luteola]|nr:MarR family transcriptional regulator [Schumannella luteola]
MSFFRDPTSCRIIRIGTSTRHSWLFQFEQKSFPTPGAPMADRKLDATELATYQALVTAGNLIERAVTAQLAEHGLTPLQFSILATLLTQGEQRMRDLADAIVHSRSGLTYQVTQLEKQGLVQRAAAAGDDRGVQVALTDEGRARVEGAFPGHTALVRDAIFDHLERSELDAIREPLAGIVARLRERR